MQGLFARTRTGRGRIIDVSLYHALADWMNVPYLQTRYGGKPPVCSATPRANPSSIF